MRTTFILCAPIAILLLAGCPDKPDAGPPPARSSANSVSAPSAPSAAPLASATLSAKGPVARPSSTTTAHIADNDYGASNADAIARYENEKPLGDVADTINWDMRVRTAPSVKDGEVIVALASGTPVVKEAKRGQWFLITFADPKDKSRKVLGWTWEQAFFPLSGKGDETKLCACWKKENPGQECDAVAGIATGECDRTYGDDCEKLIACVHGQLAPKCMPNERLLAAQDACARTCKRNGDCPNDQICTEAFGDPNVCRPAKVLTE